AAVAEDLPIIVHVTVEQSGRLLIGSDIAAVAASLLPLGVDGLGLNCATGPAEMGEHLRYLARRVPVPLSVMPNAGLPELTAAGAVYRLGPAAFAAQVARLAEDCGLALAGGCCGTTPEHIRALAACLAGQPTAVWRQGREAGPGAPAAAGQDRSAAGQDQGEGAGRMAQARSWLVPARAVEAPSQVASTYAAVDLAQDVSYLAVGERANANGSKAFRAALEEGRFDDCVEIAREQVRDGAHVIDLSVDRVGGDGAAEMAELAARCAAAVPAPLMVDSTEPAVIAAALERLPGRSLVNSVNFEDGDGPASRYRRIMAVAQEHGAAVVAICIDEAGQARGVERKLAVASRLIDSLTKDYGLALGDIVVDCLTFPIATGQEETRGDGRAAIEAVRRLTAAYPGLHTILGISNVSFGLNPAARRVLNSVFLAEARTAGLDCAIIPPGRIAPLDSLPEEARQVAEDLIWDRRRAGYDPLERLIQLYEGVTTAEQAAGRRAALAALPLGERLCRRIVEAVAAGLEDDLAEALAERSALDILNEDLLRGMRTVGERFGSGQLQLPFVLKSAETMKQAVGFLEPHFGKNGGRGKGTLVLATVKGDVHDIGKNLVDIIISNNGYSVVDLGVKQPIGAVIEAAEASDADAIGLSGLLVKSTEAMRDGLLELNRRGLAARYPVLLGGAALTRSYVEGELSRVYEGEVRYAKDAFEGLRLLDAIMAAKQGTVAQPARVDGAAAGPESDKPTAAALSALPAPAAEAFREPASGDSPLVGLTAGGAAKDDFQAASSPAGVTSAAVSREDGPPAAGRPDGRTGMATRRPAGGERPQRSAVVRPLPGVVATPQPPWWGSRVVRGIELDDVAAHLDERALFAGRWGLRSGCVGPLYEELIETDGYPRLDFLLDLSRREGLADFGVVYGYWPCYADGDSLVILEPAAAAGPPDAAACLARLDFPRQSRPPWLCLSDYFRDRAEAFANGFDVLPLQLVSVGSRLPQRAADLLADGRYRDGFELHGLSAQLAEALAEFWHGRVCVELGLADDGPASSTGRPGRSQVRSRPGLADDSSVPPHAGRRYSFGYPACPDLSQRAVLARLLDPARIGVSLSETWQLHPEHSTDALVVHHPEAAYFSV
ncbi:MAG: dihydropteroate synthase, partial [Propionibacteriaceae bacterium]|nr:dihydropteroate synthase [Propionibacteriaceae bacterium]